MPYAPASMTKCDFKISYNLAVDLTLSVKNSLSNQTSVITTIAISSVTETVSKRKYILPESTYNVNIIIGDYNGRFHIED